MNDEVTIFLFVTKRVNIVVHTVLIVIIALALVHIVVIIDGIHMWLSIVVEMESVHFLFWSPSFRHHTFKYVFLFVFEPDFLLFVI